MAKHFKSTSHKPIYSIKTLHMDNIEDVKARNARVEADKAWETSLTRRSAIAGATYLVVGFYLSMLGISHPWLNAMVPPIAYILSTLSLGFVKQVWIEKIYTTKKKSS